MSLEDRLLNELNIRFQNDNLRKLTNSSGLIDFASNDYLGLSRSHVLQERISKNWIDNKMNGSTGSRLLTGNSELSTEVENQLSIIFNSESALLFNSGYMANLGMLSCIPKRGDTIIYDELSHACIKDGARLSLATRFSFKHNDLEDLERKLKKATGEIFIVVESIYSMDGDSCHLTSIIHLAERYDAKLIIDEAHSTGVMGENGNGLSAQYADRIFCRIATFGKAMGVHGAVVLGTKTLIDYLINFSRPTIYTTAPSPHSLVSIQQAFYFLEENMVLQKQMKDIVDHFIQVFNELLSGRVLRTNSEHPIQGLLIPGNRQVKSLAKALTQKGYDVRPILAPTVKEGQERIRVCLHTFNTKDEITALLTELSKQI